MEMKVEELEKFNKGNELNDWIKHYKHHKSVMLSKEGLTVEIRESHGDKNKSRISFDQGKLAREIFKAGVAAFFNTIIDGLEIEFKNL